MSDVIQHVSKDTIDLDRVQVHTEEVSSESAAVGAVIKDLEVKHGSRIKELARVAVETRRFEEIRLLERKQEAKRLRRERAVYD